MDRQDLIERYYDLVDAAFSAEPLTTAERIERYYDLVRQGAAAFAACVDAGVTAEAMNTAWRARYGTTQQVAA